MEMEDDQQQQRPHSIHYSIRNGIARIADQRHRDERHKLTVSWGNGVDRRSLQHLVHFWNKKASHEVTELVLDFVTLLQPSDGGLEVLRSFFARSDTTLTKFTLQCDVGSAQEASQLIGAFQNNTTVTDLTIKGIKYMHYAALGNSLSGVMQSMPQLQRLSCCCVLEVEGVRAFQPALQANRTLKELDLNNSHLGDEGIRLIADALVGNKTLEILGLQDTGCITPTGLAHIARMVESTQIKTLDLSANCMIFDDNVATQRFAAVLSRHKFLKDLNLDNCDLFDEGIHLVVDGLVGNTTMEILNIDHNKISDGGLADITRLLVSAQLKTITLWENDGVFNNEDATQHFVTTLQHQKSTVQELLGIDAEDFPDRSIGETSDEETLFFALFFRRASIASASYASIENSLIRNRHLNCANLLLAPPPPPQQQQQQQRNAGTMMLKLSHKAITKFAKVPNNAGASAIFKLFQSRPQLLEKRLKRPPPPPSAATATTTTTTTTAMWIQTCHEAITIKLAKVKDNAGVSAIIKLFTARPKLLEKRLKRPPPPPAATATAAAFGGVSRGGPQQHGGDEGGSINNNSSSNNHAATESSSSSSTTIIRRQKRQRL